MARKLHDKAPKVLQFDANGVITKPPRKVEHVEITRETLDKCIAYLVRGIRDLQEGYQKEAYKRLIIALKRNGDKFLEDQKSNKDLLGELMKIY